MLIKLIFILLAFIDIASGTSTVRQNGQVIEVQGNVNQSTRIVIPFEHLVSATVSDQEYNSILVFSPNRFRLQPIKQSQPLPKSGKTLLQQLRTPFTNEYIHIFCLTNFFFIFKMPNHFLVLREQATSFVLQRQFFIPQITKKDIKFQLIDENLLAIFLPENKLILVSFEGYTIHENIFNTTNIVFSKTILPYESREIVAYFNNQLKLMQIVNNEITVKAEIGMPKSMEQVQIKVMYLQGFENDKIFWIVDADQGLLWVKMHRNQIKDEPFLFIEQKGCYELDIQLENEIKVLLTCSSRGETFFIKALFLYENHKPMLIKKWNPHIQSCKTRRFIFYQEHIFSLEKQSLDVFLPSIYKGQKEVFYMKNWISLSGHSAYWISQDKEKDRLFLYSVNNFTFTKSELILEEFTLQIKADHQLLTKFNLTLQYLCSDSSSKIKEICIYDSVIEVNIHSKHLSFLEMKSINLGIILLFSTTILAISYICYTKYKALQRKALSDLNSITNPKNIKI